MEISEPVTITLLFLQMIFSYTVFKLLIREEKFSKIEFVLLIISAPLVGSLFLFTNFIGTIVMILSMLMLGNFFVNAKKLYITGALSYSLIIMIISDHISGLADAYIWHNTGEMVEVRAKLLHTTVAMGVAIVIAFIVSKIEPIIEKRIPFLSEFYPIISIMGIFMMVIYYSSIFLGNYLGNNVEIITLNLIFFIFYFLISIATFLMYASSTKHRYEAHQKELEYLSNQRYMDVMESQFKEISKFRHDYKNILTSMENLIMDRDMDGLDEYYHSMLETFSKAIEQNDFKLEKLANIQVRALKSILASKLITTQEKGIDARIEVTETISKVNMDVVSLVRLMGIFLDNAIEELEELGEGILSVAVYKDEQAVHLIIQNSCREDIPKLHQLKTKGFSTKGMNRGNGLSNVQEIVTKADNIRLTTTIEHQLFTQKLVIEFLNTDTRRF